VGETRVDLRHLLEDLRDAYSDALEQTILTEVVWINDAHPAYTRAAASPSAGYHVALSVALALAPLAVETTGEHAFITRFLAHWGGAPAREAAARSRRRRLA
jgi:hypothetical protein